MNDKFKGVVFDRSSSRFFIPRADGVMIAVKEDIFNIIFQCDVLTYFLHKHISVDGVRRDHSLPENLVYVHGDEIFLNVDVVTNYE